jgi:hypothetical protein
MTYRKPHTLDTTQGDARPTQAIFFDTETVPRTLSDRLTVQDMKLAVGWHCRTSAAGPLVVQDEIVTANKGDFFPWLDGRLRDKSTCYLVAHNIVFDLTVLGAWSTLPAMGWTLKSFYTKGITSLFRWTNGNRKLIGLDNTNLFPGKLATWGDLVGLPKLSVNFGTVTDDDLLTYCRRDVDIIRRCWLMWLDFLDENKCGSFKPTVGSTAFNTWRHSHLKEHIWIDNNPLALQLERESYKGGRTEVLYKGRREDGPYYYLDVNNMYGYILSRYEFPAALVGSAEVNDPHMLLRKLEKYNVIARVALDTTDNPYPYKYDGHTCYPVGHFDTTLTTPEIIHAIQAGWLRGVGAMSWYRAAPLFREFVLHWHGKRREYRQAGNKGFAEISKLLINSLYGKFGQSGFDQRVIGSISEDEIWSMSIINIDTQTVSRQIAIGGTLYEETRSGESYNSFVAIAAHVTAYARLYLHTLRTRAGVGNTFYMDTDSLLVNQRGADNLAGVMDPVQMGRLKVELSSPWVEINAPKDYGMYGRCRVKGVSSSAIPLGDDSYLQDQWVRMSGMIQRGNMEQYVIRKQVKHLLRRVYSGVVTESGWVEPFHLAESVLSRSPVDLPLFCPPE